MIAVVVSRFIVSGSALSLDEHTVEVHYIATIEHRHNGRSVSSLFKPMLSISLYRRTNSCSVMSDFGFPSNFSSMTNDFAIILCILLFCLWTVPISILQNSCD